MKTQGLALLCFVFSSALIWSCKNQNPPDCLKSVGKYHQISKALPDFSGIVVGDKIDLVLVTDPNITENTITLSGGENVLPKIKIEITADGFLKIADLNTCNWVRNLQTRITAEVRCKPVAYLELNGFSKLITPDSLKYDRLDIEFTSAADLNLLLSGKYLVMNHRGVGEVQMQGRTDISVFTLYNVAGLDARNLHSDWSFVYSYSTADTWVRPLKGLGTHIFELGNVFYTREPWEHLEYVREGKGERKFVEIN